MFVLLVVEQLPQDTLLFVAAFEHQQHSFHRKAAVSRSEVEFRTRQRMRVAFQRREARFIDGFGDEWSRARGLRA